MTLRRTQLIAVLLVTLLVVAPLVASVCHHHFGSSDINCPICHFNHQPMDRPLAAQRMPTLDVLRNSPAPAEPRTAAAQSTPPLPSRAPPSA